MMNDQITDTELNCLRSLLRAAEGVGIPVFAVGASALARFQLAKQNTAPSHHDRLGLRRLRIRLGCLSAIV